MWLILAVDYHALLHYVPMLYIASVVALLGAPTSSGETAFGSRRWIPLRGGLHLQVSEFVKLVIILLVARYLTELKTEELEIREMLKLAGLVVVPALLVLKQPDLGTALTYLAVLIVGAFLAGLRWKYVAVIAVVAVLVLPVGCQFPEGLSEGAAGEFHGSRPGPAGHGYQLIQSEDRGWIGRDVRQGSHQGNPDPASVSAGAAQGFHLLGICRGAWVRRCSGMCWRCIS